MLNRASVSDEFSSNQGGSEGRDLQDAFGHENVYTVFVEKIEWKRSLELTGNQY
jgi:hypothetical protein